MEALQAWLNDKKNTPIIIGGFVALLVVLALLYFTVLSPGGGDEVVEPAPNEGLPGASVTSAPPVAQPAPPAGPEVASATSLALQPPLEVYRQDPFRPVFGPKPRKSRFINTSRVPRMDIRQLKPVIPTQEHVVQERLPAQPQRRMAGILKNGQVFAIIVTDGGQSGTYKPGDLLDENIAVDRIMPDKVILRSTKLKKPEYIEVPMSAGNPPPSSSVTSAPGAPAVRPPSLPRGRGGARSNSGGGGFPPPPAP